MRPAGAGFFPLDRQLQIGENHWSEQVAKLAVWLSGLVEFEQAAEILARVGQLSMSTSMSWRRVKTWGQHFQAHEQAAEAQAVALPTRDMLIPGERRSGARWGLPSTGRW